jgi:hypothetical protein
MRMLALGSASPRASSESGGRALIPHRCYKQLRDSGLSYLTLTPETNAVLQPAGLLPELYGDFCNARRLGGVSLAHDIFLIL